MKTIVVEGQITEELRLKWDCFVEQHNDGNIFQTSFYYYLFANNNLFRPIALLLTDDSNNIKGVLSGHIQYILPSPFHFFSSRCILIGGPLTENNDHSFYQILINSFDKYINHKVVYIQFRNLFDTSSIQKLYSEFNYKYEDHLNIIVDISLSDEVLWKKTHKRRREQIRKAIRLGLTLKLIKGQKELHQSYSILRSLYNKIKLPLFPYQIFENALKYGSERGYTKFFGAYFEDKLIGTMYTLCFKNRIYDFFAGSNSQYLHLFPNSFLPWKIFLWGKENGLTIFDWGGAGKPEVYYGVRDYKEKFGGEYVNFGRYTKINKPIIYDFSKMILDFTKSIHKKFV